MVVREDESGPCAREISVAADYTMRVRDPHAHTLRNRAKHGEVRKAWLPEEMDSVTAQCAQNLCRRAVGSHEVLGQHWEAQQNERSPHMREVARIAVLNGASDPFL